MPHIRPILRVHTISKQKKLTEVWKKLKIVWQLKMFRFSAHQRQRLRFIAGTRTQLQHPRYRSQEIYRIIVLNIHLAEKYFK
jgi:hypothetical protein